jgi:poly(3-hydroxybutyrate) depolymerase
MKSLESGSDFWRTANGADRHSSEAVTKDVTRDTYTNSKTGKELSVMTLKGSGHGWPGSGHSVDGNPSAGVNASEEIWKFLSKHSRDAKPPGSAKPIEPMMAQK